MKPRDLETVVTCDFQDITEGKMIKEVILKEANIGTDIESLQSLDLHTVIELPKGADPEIPLKFSLEGN